MLLRPGEAAAESNGSAVDMRLQWRIKAFRSRICQYHGEFPKRNRAPSLRSDFGSDETLDGADRKMFEDKRS